MKPLALDIATFDRLRTEGFLYVDKTREIYEVVRPNAGFYFFLSRPRRFGKSLLISTMEKLFEGRKELFEGLYIYDKIDWEEWGSFPVIRINFSEIDSRGSKTDFANAIIDYIHYKYAEKYDVDVPIGEKGLKGYFGNLAQKIHEKTGKPIALLIDEYDKPILDHITDVDQARANQEVLRDFYDLVKNIGHHWRIVFLTGISKFSRMSVFSVMNLLQDISERRGFDSLPGFTQQDLEQYFGEYLEAFAQKFNISKEQVLKELKEEYNGYSWSGEQKVYNPFSLLNAFRDLEFKNYWYSTGTPRMLVSLIKQAAGWAYVQNDLTQVKETGVTDDFFKSSDIEDLNIKSLLFQTGYLTVKKTNRPDGRSLRYYLGFPNFEVEWSFSAYLLHRFSKIPLDYVQPSGQDLMVALNKEDLDTAFELIRKFFNQIPYQLRKNTDEAFYHSNFQMLMNLTGVRMQSERSSARGRMDGVLDFPDKYYLMEFKFSSSGKMEDLLVQAMEQIRKKKYPDVLELEGKKIICLGVGFLETKMEGQNIPTLTINYEAKGWPF